MNKEDFINSFRKYVQNTRDLSSLVVEAGDKDSEINQRMPEIVTNILETAPKKIKEAVREVTEDEKTKARREFYNNARKYLLENVYPIYKDAAQDAYNNPDMLTRAKLRTAEKAIDYSPTVIDKTVDMFRNAVGDATSPFSDFFSGEDGASSQEAENRDVTDKEIVGAVSKYFGITPSSSKSENSGWMNTLEDTIDSAGYDSAKKYVSEYEKKHGIKSNSKAEDDGDGWIEYTYKPGDTFGQVILDQGLATSHGLWGADGDVAYYNQFLDPSKMASYGIPVGTTIRLKKRK